MLANVKTSDDSTSVKPYKSAQFDAYLTFRALGGMITSDTGAFKSMTQTEFCDTYNISEMTLWRWQRQTPNFAQLVRQRRDEVVPLARETAAFNRLYLIGMGSLGDHAAHRDQRAAVDALKTYVGHYSELRLPTQRQEIEIHGSAAELLKAAHADGIIEGELADAAEPDATADGQNAGVLPLPS
jgi:hypothetical protein